jgi:hypothetical protein
MQARFRARIAAIIAENTARQAALPPKLPFNIYEMNISGGGDGHTFVVDLLLSTYDSGTDPTQSWSAEDLGEVDAFFWLASSEEGLRGAAAATLAAAFEAGVQDIETVAVGTAGSAKGTRFMGFLAGEVESL